jgi:protein transport protein SEC61 subunit gamma-like protein
MEEANKPQAEQVKKPGLFGKIRDKLKQYKRVLSVAHKPDREDFIHSSRITGIGIVFLGAIGFIIFLLYYLIQSIGSGA